MRAPNKIGNKQIIEGKDKRRSKTKFLKKKEKKI